MSEKTIGVFGLGQCSLDYVGKIAAYPPPDVKCEFTDMVIQGGGPVATALVALARWGLSCFFAGVTGDDQFGPMIGGSLEKEGIDTSGIVTRRGSSSQFAFIAAEPSTGTRTIFWQRPTGAPLSAEEVNVNLIREVGVLHTDGLFIDASLCACKTAKRLGVPVVVDAGTLREGMLEVARFSDYFIASEKFASQLTGDEDPLEACKIISEMGPRMVGITLGKKGYVALAEGKIIRRPAYKVEVVDTTGCGDVFHAGFIYGLVQGWGVEKSLDLGAWAAAMVARKMGGRSGIPPFEALRVKTEESS